MAPSGCDSCAGRPGQHRGRADSCRVPSGARRAADAGGQSHAPHSVGLQVLARLRNFSGRVGRWLHVALLHDIDSAEKDSVRCVCYGFEPKRQVARGYAEMERKRFLAAYDIRGPSQGH
jgi:hypothetical protein